MEKKIKFWWNGKAYFATPKEVEALKTPADAEEFVKKIEDKKTVKK